ncbi:MAG: MBL fold metallo-hydrolase, partial [Chromatiaceae bacterium]|nr:MBL fold metallo-hydrolase [Chromatiaceae bacterium]MCF8016428.1 MBL fold metallo-hydrolase [Chromatiaceae bacterium]
MLQLGPMRNLVYVIADHGSRRAAVVDPGWDATAIVQALSAAELCLTDILITHGHDDHVNALALLLGRTTMPGYQPVVHALAQEVDYWKQAASAATPAPAPIPDDRTGEVWASPPPPQLHRHHDGDRIRLGATEITCIATPGHSPGGACYRLPGQLITGDTLFVYGCGRCDLPGGDPEQMFQSLQRLKAEIPDETTLLPGHHYAAATTSTMGEQRRANPFLHFDDAEAFCAFRAEHNNHRHPP